MTLLFDDARYRNASSARMHNVLGWDGATPGELRAKGRAELLAYPGLHELWGDVALPCPYCHGHEFSPGPIAVISSGGHADHVAALLRGLSDSVPVLAPAEAACVFVPPNSAPRSSIADDLGVQVSADGIHIDALGRTNRDDVWAAGDSARRVDARIPPAVITAMSSRLIAAADSAASAGAARQP